MNDSSTPPRLVERLVGALLPPSRREQVLGDLEERFRDVSREHSRYVARWRYLQDAITIVPAVFWSQRREWRIGSCAPSPLHVGAGVGFVRGQVEAFQQENYCRFLFYTGMMTAISALTLGLTSTRGSWQGSLVGLTFVALQIFTIFQHERRGNARTVSENASIPELIAFHRRELARRRDFLRTLWYWKWLPLVAPFLVVTALKPAGVNPYAILTMVCCFTAAGVGARRQAKSLQRQLDDLSRLP